MQLFNNYICLQNILIIKPIVWDFRHFRHVLYFQPLNYNGLIITIRVFMTKQIFRSPLETCPKLKAFTKLSILNTYHTHAIPR